MTDSNSVQLVLTTDGMEAENVGWSSDNTRSSAFQTETLGGGSRNGNDQRGL
ncbi:MAG: hypothetical protein ACLRSW_09355 [Christensenellaceae bacterium]